ncbi:MAG: HD domain-containing protein [Candidatus Coatesbacteria bacterium]|nr:HD domain-containing protein [Candidatus Coatesbacteria bacterium]
MGTRGVRDPIHGFIRFSPLEKDIIDHPAFQRLRRIQQLGFSSMVYPGARHTRFDHSIGVMHLAGQMFDAIAGSEKGRDTLSQVLGRAEGREAVKDRFRAILRLAALLHDVGHPPFSHASDEVMPQKRVIKVMRDGQEAREVFRHEDYTLRVIEDVLKDEIRNNDLGITWEDVAGLLGHASTRLRPALLVWKEILSSQIDADRADYLLRDSLYTGVKYGVYDCVRLLETQVLVQDPGQDNKDSARILVEKGGWHVAESFVVCRYLMFTQVYFHKTTRAFEHHYARALKSILETFQGWGKLPSPDEIHEYLKYDDYAMWDLIARGAKENNPDCRALVDRVHYRCVYETSEDPLKAKRQAEDLHQLKERLQKLGIDVFEDTSEKVWYETDGAKEVQVYDDMDNIRPVKSLSEMSSLARAIGATKQTRLYISKADKKKPDVKKIIGKECDVLGSA